MAVSILAVLLLAGGTTAAVLVINNQLASYASEAAEERAAQGPPDKYSRIPDCDEVAAKLPDLPESPIRQPQPNLHDAGGELRCSFGGPYDPNTGIDMSLFLTNLRYPVNGTAAAAEYFGDKLGSGGREFSGLGFGDRAAWSPDTSGDISLTCPLWVLDGNLVLEISHSTLDEVSAQGENPNGPKCREPTIRMAERIHRDLFGGN